MLRVVTRVLIVNDGKILLARNKGAKFWYPPGGGWEYNQENLHECVIREVKEETGYLVQPIRPLCIREFREESKTSLELFWLAELSKENTQTIDALNKHIDVDVNGSVEEAKWHDLSSVNDLKILPKFTIDLLNDNASELRYFSS